MPIYEYRCHQCSRRSTFLVINLNNFDIPCCKHCGSPNLEKLISRVRRLRSEEDRLEALADPGNLAGLDENDPVSMAKWMKRMGKEMGEEMGGEDFEQMVDEAAHDAEREQRGEKTASFVNPNK